MKISPTPSSWGASLRLPSTLGHGGEEGVEDHPVEVEVDPMQNGLAELRASIRCATDGLVLFQECDSDATVAASFSRHSSTNNSSFPPTVGENIPRIRFSFSFSYSLAISTSSTSDFPTTTLLTT
ncbi:B-box type zinc finger protein with CCT domain [Striga asiatica]|uniref:B-box type zinc finger protein with CCT domain n=1 Tax=Striga asiatica TaxID=4170 RepID=A0A5A7Q8B9_STRAF|nr:B-box type zinc finger protein with CCT domain [Striga asiatica]